MRKGKVSRRLLLKILFGILFLAFFLQVVTDPDLGFHLKTGEYIWETGRVPKKDIFSFTLPDYPYVYHSWLSEAILFKINSLWGLWGVTFFYAFLGATALLLVLEIVELRVERDWIYIFLAILVPMVRYYTNLRIQLVTLLGLALVYFIFRKNLENRGRRVWFLPLIFAFWANLHGGFFLGLVLWLVLLGVELLVFLIEEILPVKVWSERGRKISGREGLRLGGVGFLAALAAGIGPYGWRVYEQALKMGTNQFSALHNMDWWPLVKSETISWVIAAWLAGGLILVTLIKSRVELREKLVGWLFFLLALKLNRLVLPLLVVWLPMIIVFLTELEKKAKKVLSQMWLALFLVCLSLFLVYFGQVYDYLGRMERAYKDEAAYAKEMRPPYEYPYGVVEYIKKNEVPEAILNDYNWGGYLIWKLPERKWFIDGRMDNFFKEGKPFAEIHRDMVVLAPGWEEELENFETEAVLLSVRWPLAQVLKFAPGWEVAYEDENAILHVKREEK